MSHELKEGMSIRMVWGPDWKFDTQENIDCMTVREQTGQMSMVPWIRVEEHGRPDRFINCALIEGLELEPVPRRHAQTDAK